MAELDSKVLPEEGGEQQEAPQLGLQDIATFVQIIDLVSRRGGFEGKREVRFSHRTWFSVRRDM